MKSIGKVDLGESRHGVSGGNGVPFSKALGLTCRRLLVIGGLAGWIFLSLPVPLAHSADSVAGDSVAGATVARSQGTPDFVGIQEECRVRIKQLRDEALIAQANRTLVRPQLAKELELWGQLELITEEWRLAYEDRVRHESGVESNNAGRQAYPSPSSFLEVDELRARRVAAGSSLRALQLEVRSENRISDGIQKEYQEAEQDRRRSSEALSGSAVDQRLARQQTHALLELQSRVLKANLDLHAEQVDQLQSQVQDATEEIESLEALINAPTSRFKLTQPELDQRLAVLDGFEKQVRDQLSTLDAQIRQVMRQRQSGGGVSDSNYAIIREETQLLRDLLSHASMFKECWRRRFQLSNFDVPASDVQQWVEDGEQLRLQVAQIDEKLRLRTQQRREALSLLTRAVGGVSGVTAPRATADNSTLDAETLSRIQELENVLDFYGGIQVLATTGGRLCDLFLEDLSVKQSGFSLADNVELLGSWVSAAWEFEITESEGKAITVKKVVIGLVLLLVGYLVSRALASLVAFKLLPRFGVSHAAASVLRSVMLYAMLIALFFVSLDVVNVPLTFFAFLGGAAAIGLGFGSQNLLNNFISGLILLVERPIRVGDLVNVDGIDANVEHIGARSTRVRTGSNLEILVPNSKFLENNVTNWTLSDTRIRTSVSVGVAYGSPVKEVVERLQQVIRVQDKVMATPEPIVLFQDFGDSSLAFEVHFWVHMKRIMDGAKVRSSVRAAIDEDFRKAGIVIAFPQRDVHIDMHSPLEVRLTGDEPQQAKPEASGDSRMVSGVHRLRRVG